MKIDLHISKIMPGNINLLEMFGNTRHNYSNQKNLTYIYSVSVYIHILCKIYLQTFFEIFDFGIDFFQLHSTGSMFSPFMEPEVVQFGIGPKLNK